MLGIFSPLDLPSFLPAKIANMANMANVANLSCKLIVKDHVYNPLLQGTVYADLSAILDSSLLLYLDEDDHHI